MKLVMTLLVRDEEDILEANIEYHFSRGVDFIIVTDNLSVDRTPEILNRYVKQGKLQVIDESSDDYSQAEWVTRMARIAQDDHSADWVCHSDADELWWVDPSSSLKEELRKVPDEYNVAKAQRYNFPPCNNGNEEGILKSMIYREIESRNSLGILLPPKIIHRSVPMINIAQGNHTAFINQDEGRLPSYDISTISIFHFPLRSYRQFSNKIKKGGAAYERNTRLDPKVGDSWRHLYQRCQEGGLEEYYLEQVLNKADVDDLIEEEKLIKDTRLLDYLEKNGIRS